MEPDSLSFLPLITQGRPGGGGAGVVEYENTPNKRSNTSKITLKLVKNIKIKKNTLYFIPKIGHEGILYTQF